MRAARSSRSLVLEPMRQPCRGGRVVASFFALGSCGNSDWCDRIAHHQVPRRCLQGVGTSPLERACRKDAYLQHFKHRARFLIVCEDIQLGADILALATEFIELLLCLDGVSFFRKPIGSYAQKSYPWLLRGAVFCLLGFFSVAIARRRYDP